MLKEIQQKRCWPAITKDIPETLLSTDETLATSPHNELRHMYLYSDECCTEYGRTWWLLIVTMGVVLQIVYCFLSNLV